jgi:diaminopimelate epimerase
MRFVKMHGLGNDFIVIDAIRQQIALHPVQIRQLADRHFGIGCDQLLLVEPALGAGVDFRYRIFNADGGEVQQCGNGARCFARFVRDEGLSDKETLVVETASGTITLTIEKDGQVRVNMGEPRFAPASLPFVCETQSDRYPLELNIHGREESVSLGAVSMGNPHAVLRVESIAAADVATLGPAIGHHPRFPQRVNVGFMQIINRQQIALRVFERGSGETLACGTGAAAAVAIGQIWGLLDSVVTVQLAGGELRIEWQGRGSPLWMIGPACRVFNGEIEL